MKSSTKYYNSKQTRKDGTYRYTGIFTGVALFHYILKVLRYNE